MLSGMRVPHLTRTPDFAALKKQLIGVAAARQ